MQIYRIIAVMDQTRSKFLDTYLYVKLMKRGGDQIERVVGLYEAECPHISIVKDFG